MQYHELSTTDCFLSVGLGTVYNANTVDYRLNYFIQMHCKVYRKKLITRGLNTDLL